MWVLWWLLIFSKKKKLLNKTLKIFIPEAFRMRMRILHVLPASSLNKLYSVTRYNSLKETLKTFIKITIKYNRNKNIKLQAFTDKRSFISLTYYESLCGKISKLLKTCNINCYFRLQLPLKNLLCEVKPRLLPFDVFGFRV